MKPATLITCICLISPTALVSAQGHDSGSHTQQAAEPVNAMCPIGKEPIVSSAGTVEYKGKTIGLCCPGCGEAFLAWDEARKDEFVALAVLRTVSPAWKTMQVTTWTSPLWPTQHGQGPSRSPPVLCQDKTLVPWATRS